MIRRAMRASGWLLLGAAVMTKGRCRMSKVLRWGSALALGLGVSIKEVFMIRSRKIPLILGSLLLASLAAGIMVAQEAPASNRLPTTREVPNAFGTVAYSVTTVPAVAFYPEKSSFWYYTSGSWGRYSFPGGELNNYFAGIDLPAGVVIDFIGLNSTTNAPFVIGAEVARRDKSGNLTVIGGIDSAVHDSWDTDFNQVPIGYTWNGRSGEALILHVQTGSDPNPQYFGWVEIWWRRTVSPAPGSPTFNDVPTNHPFFQFIEALAASGITGGCGPSTYCPDNPVTRGQMAVFLAKALGLHWPN